MLICGLPMETIDSENSTAYGNTMEADQAKMADLEEEDGGTTKKKEKLEMKEHQRVEKEMEKEAKKGQKAEKKEEKEKVKEIKEEDKKKQRGKGKPEKAGNKKWFKKFTRIGFAGLRIAVFVMDLLEYLNDN